VNPYEPAQTTDVSPHKPVKRFSVVIVPLIVIPIMVGMFGLGVWRSYTAQKTAQLEQQRAYQQQMRANQAAEKQ